MPCKTGKIYKKANTNLPQICTGHLSEQQQEVLQHLLDGKSVAEAAQLTGYAAQSVYRLMRDPGFKLAFAEQAKGMTMSLAPAALRKIAQLITDSDTPAAVQFQAARYLLDRCFGRPDVGDDTEERDSMKRMSLQELLDLRAKLLAQPAILENQSPAS